MIKAGVLPQQVIEVIGFGLREGGADWHTGGIVRLRQDHCLAYRLVHYHCMETACVNACVGVGTQIHLVRRLGRGGSWLRWKPNAIAVGTGIARSSSVCGWKASRT